MDDGYAHSWASTECCIEAIEASRDGESPCGARNREMVLIVRMADRYANAVPEDDWQEEFEFRLKATQGVSRHMVTTLVTRWQYVIASKISTLKTACGAGIVRVFTCGVGNSHNLTCVSGCMDNSAVMMYWAVNRATKASRPGCR